MRIPDPKANTTTEAYLAYKAGYLEESELKPKLYKPDWHFDGWLAYWAGLVNTYPTKENGDPEMLCDEEALVAYLSGVTDTYPEEIKDPYDVRIVGYLRHLASIRWPEPDYPVNNEEFYLSTMEPTHTSNSEPSSDIELDTAEGKIISVEAYGDTYQQTYDGKNLFNKSMAPTVIGGGTNTVTETATGVRITLNTAGTYSFRGWIVGKVSDYLNKTLTLSANVSKSADGVSPNMYLGYCDDVGGTRKSVASASGEGEKSCSTQITEVDADGREYIIVALYGTEGRDASIDDYSQYDDVQLQIGEKTAYEPYVGGVPAPNPDYPQDIQVVTGEQRVDVTGKNLWGGFINDYSLTDHGIAFVNYKDGSISANGTASSNAYSMYAAAAASGGRTQQFPAGTYTLSGGTNEVRAMFIIVGPGTSYITDATTGKVTFTLSETVSGYIRAYIKSGMSVNGTIHPQLELNSTATAYEPYQSQSYHISLGSIELRKIGNYQDYIYKSGDDWYVHKEVGKVIWNGTETWSYDGSYPRASIARPSDFGSAYQDQATTTKCTHFIAGNTASMDDSYNVGSSALFFRASSIMTSLANWNTWLSNNNMSFYYKLATPTDTQITDATLVGQLEALAGADTYNEKTFIGVTATDPNLPALLKVEAYKY